LAKTLDLASALDTTAGGSIPLSSSENKSYNCPSRSVLTIAFQFPCDVHAVENVAAMARKYVRTVVASVLQVAMALSSNLSHLHHRQPIERKQSADTPELLILIQKMLKSYQ
jgi:homeobox-leucine zipper protein